MGCRTVKSKEVNQLQGLHERYALTQNLHMHVTDCVVHDVMMQTVQATASLCLFGCEIYGMIHNNMVNSIQPTWDSK